ncbi:hypothetical protein G9A89_020783 [Geosiphon pyriformis]|nr:hypothetical protein G9A89_020783 [Geosiphon pyriformis]
MNTTANATTAATTTSTTTTTTTITTNNKEIPTLQTEKFYSVNSIPCQQSVSPTQTQQSISSQNAQVSLSEPSIKAESESQGGDTSAGQKDPNDTKKKRAGPKRRKVTHACVYCRRSHMTCDDGRPCQRCIKRSIGHLCHDEPKTPHGASQITGGHPQITANLIALPSVSAEAFGQMAAYSPIPQTPLRFASAQMGNEFTVISDFLDNVDGNQQALFNLDGTPNNVSEKFFLIAADPSDGTSEARLTQVINAKFEAGFLKPYNYVKGYARLQQYMENNMTNMNRQRILSSLGTFRPAFRTVAQSLMDFDLVLVEEQFERLLLDYDRVFSSMGIPACLWRRTGEIYKGNKEFASLVGVPIEMLRDGRLCIYENRDAILIFIASTKMMAEESAVNYWEVSHNLTIGFSISTITNDYFLRRNMVISRLTQVRKLY